MGSDRDAGLDSLRPFRDVFSAVRKLVDAHDDVRMLYPVHPNPNVVGPAQELLSDHPRIELVEPLGKDTLLYFEHGAQRPTIAVVNGTGDHRAGSRMALTISPDALYLFDSEGVRVRGA